MKTRIVLITGCSTGIGFALASACLARGDHVIATARNPDTLAALSNPGSPSAGRCTPLALDVNRDEDIQRVVATVQDEFGHLDVLINNAGYAAMGPVTELPQVSLQAQFATNVFAPVAMTQACLPLLRASKQAQVVNVGSVSGILTTPFSGAYCATKAALHSLSDAMRMELKPLGIQMITVQPGAIESSFGDTSLAGVDDLIDDASPYKPLEDKIQERAMASQQNPTTAAEFAESLLRAMEKPSLTEVRIGNGSRALPAIKRWLPTRWVDAILSKRFGLNTLVN